MWIIAMLSAVLMVCVCALSSATGEVQLRHVEKDVLIPKLMREKAKELCADKVQGVCD